MTRPRVFSIGAVLAAAVLVLPAFAVAQDPPPRGNAGSHLPSGGGSNAGGGGSMGTAVSRGDAGGGVSSGSGSSWSGGNSSSGGSSGAGTAGWSDSGRRAAVGRGTAGDNRRNPSGSGSDEGRVAPWYSRSREGRPVVGTAAGREDVGRPAPGGGGGYWGRPYDWDYYYGGYYGSYYGSYYGYPGYYGSCGAYGAWYGPCRSMFGFGAFGLGYFYYDPSWWSYYGGGAYGGAYGGGAYGGAGGGGAYSSSSATAGIKLKVKPSNAQVFVDGYFAGEVSEFDGVFQRLPLASGEHRIEIRAPGFDALTFDVTVEPYQVINYKGELKKQ